MKSGYCCNVHGGTTLEEVKNNLQRFACEVKKQVSANAPMPVGLWLSQSAIAGLGSENKKAIDATNQFGDWLAERGLEPFTFNGFPLGDFHQPVVKHEVYKPTWAEQSRLDYTIALARIQTMLLDRFDVSNRFQSISTLPLGWPQDSKERAFSDDTEYLLACAKNLQALAIALAEHREETGNHVIVCIEPEPGCVLDHSDDIAKFFQDYLFSGEGRTENIIREHIGVCHDICHSAVMFEDQALAVKAYRESGIQIGKVQVSSAIKVSFCDDPDLNAKKKKQLAEFSEPKYLHQTSVRNSNGEISFFEDLNVALNESANPGDEWRVHFHVPIFASQLGLIDCTQDEIALFMKASEKAGVSIEHFEVETYAWNVLPQEHRDATGELADGIARELSWFAHIFETKKA